MAERDDLQRALEAGLAALAAGEGLEQILARQPALAGELRPLLLAAQMAGADARPARVPPAAQAASRAQFLASAAELRIGAAPAARRAQWSVRLSLVRILAIGLIFLAGTYGVVTASAQSLPGDALYGVKRTVESAQLLLAPDVQSRARLNAEFDDQRLKEVQAVTQQGRLVRVDFTGTLEARSGAASDHWSVSGVVVVVGPQVPTDGYPTIGARLQVEGTVEAGGLVLADHITVLPTPLPAPTVTVAPSSSPTATSRPAATATPAPAETVAFSGVLQSIQPGAWQVDGQTVIIDAATEISDDPQVGQIVSVEASRRADGALVARRIGLAGGGAPAATPTPSATEDHGAGPSASNTPQPTEDHGGGPSPSNTPKPTDSGGPSPSNTPKPTDDGGGGPSPSHTPEPTDDGGGGPSPSNTPQPTDSGGPSPSNTPMPTDNDGGDGGGGASQTPRPTDSGGPSPSNTPKPTDDGGGDGGGGPSPSNTPQPTETDHGGGLSPVYFLKMI